MPIVLRAPDQPAQHVAPELIGAEQEGLPPRLQRPADQLGLAVGGEQRRQDRNRDVD